MHDALEPAGLLLEELERLRAAAGRHPVLDVACGGGRNALLAARSGLHTVGLDRDVAALARMRAQGVGLPLEAVRVDLESGHEIPIRDGSCGGILVFRFLFRPLARALVQRLRPGGLLIYETFTTHQRDLGQGPRNAAFLLEPGELPALFPGLRVLRSEEGVFDQPRPQAMARLVGVKD